MKKLIVLCLLLTVSSAFGQGSVILKEALQSSDNILESLISPIFKRSGREGAEYVSQSLATSVDVYRLTGKNLITALETDPKAKALLAKQVDQLSLDELAYVSNRVSKIVVGSDANGFFNCGTSACPLLEAGSGFTDLIKPINANLRFWMKKMPDLPLIK